MSNANFNFFSTSTHFKPSVIASNKPLFCPQNDRVILVVIEKIFEINDAHCQNYSLLQI